MKDINEKLAKFWNHCDTTFSHNEISKWLKSENDLYKSWNK